MTDTTISVRVDRELLNRMRKMEHINWSAILRRALINELSKFEEVDREKRIVAGKKMDEIRKSGIFSGGKDSVQIIREWRNKRK